MATVSWVGNGQQIAQQVTLTVTAVANGGTLTATINGKNVTYTCTASDTTTTAATAWAALLNARTAPPEFQQITWSASTTVITGVSDVAGLPFYSTGTGTGGLSKSQAGGASVTLAQTVANSSQNDVGNAANWSRLGIAALPTTGDDVVVANTSVSMLYNLQALNGVTLNSWTRYQSFTGTIGLPENNPLGYVEFRPTYLQLASSVNQSIAAFQLLLGAGTTGNGPTRERYDMQSYRTNLVVLASGSAADQYAIRFLGSHGQNTVTLVGTSVGICMLPTEAAAGTATISQATVDGGGTLDMGTGCAFSGTAGGGTITITGGSSTMFNTPSAIVAKNDATITLAAVNGTYSSITATNSCSLTILAAMTISVITLAKGCTLDASNSLGAVTITTSTLDGDTCQVNDPNNVITWTNATTVLAQVTDGPFIFTGSRTVRII